MVTLRVNADLLCTWSSMGEHHLARDSCPQLASLTSTLNLAALVLSLCPCGLVVGACQAVPGLPGLVVAMLGAAPSLLCGPGRGCCLPRALFLKWSVDPVLLSKGLDKQSSCEMQAAFVI